MIWVRRREWFRINLNFEKNVGDVFENILGTSKMISDGKKLGRREGLCMSSYAVHACYRQGLLYEINLGVLE